MYTEVGTVSKATIVQLKCIVSEVSWEVHVSDVTAHEAAPCTEPIKDVAEIVERWPIDTWRHFSFFRLRAGGNLYRHADAGFGFHVPVETNDDCMSLSFENGVRKEHHLEVGKIYSVDRSIEHESFNNGETDRTHLIVLLKESNNE